MNIDITDGSCVPPLADDIDKELERLRLIPTAYKASCLDVIRAALELLGSMPNAEIDWRIKSSMPVLQHTQSGRSK